jgi:hypothetical protein
MTRAKFAVCTVLVLLAVGPAWAVCDTAPPVLTNFDFTPQSVNVTSEPSVPITCSMTVTDNLAGVAEATCTFTSPLFGKVLSCTAIAPSSGNRRDGTFECSLTIPRYAESGTWTVSVTAQDALFAESTYGSAELGTAGFPFELNVTSTQDLQPPVLTDFDFSPQSVNVDAASATVTCDMTLTDDLAGVDIATCQFQSMAGSFLSAACSAEAPVSGDRNNGTFSCDALIPQYAPGGAWLARVTGTDAAGNAVIVESFLLQIQGFPSELTVSSNNADLAPPALSDFSFTPLSVDVSSAPARVSCSAEFSDSPSGIVFAGCIFNSPSQTQQAFCINIAPSSGTPQSGTYDCTAIIPAYAEGGIWVPFAVARDAVGNIATIDGTVLGMLGFPNELDVFCGGAEEPSLRWDSATTLAWYAIAGATRYNVYRAALTDPGTNYGTCQSARDGDVTDLTFTETETPALDQGWRYLVSATTSSGEGALGKASDGTPRAVTTACP